jgi:hypothetical protein
MRWVGDRQRSFVNDRHNTQCVGHRKLPASLVHAAFTGENRCWGVLQAQTSPMEKSIRNRNKCPVNARILPLDGGVAPGQNPTTTLSQQMFGCHQSRAIDLNPVFSYPLTSLHGPNRLGGEERTQPVFGLKNELSRSQQSLQHQPAAKPRAAPGLSIVGFPTPRNK